MSSSAFDENESAQIRIISTEFGWSMWQDPIHLEARQHGKTLLAVQIVPDLPYPVPISKAHATWQYLALTIQKPRATLIINSARVPIEIEGKSVSRQEGGGMLFDVTACYAKKPDGTLWVYGADFPSITLDGQADVVILQEGSGGYRSFRDQSGRDLLKCRPVWRDSDQAKYARAIFDPFCDEGDPCFVPAIAFAAIRLVLWPEGY